MEELKNRSKMRCLSIEQKAEGFFGDSVCVKKNDIGRVRYRQLEGYAHIMHTFCTHYTFPYTSCNFSGKTKISKNIIICLAYSLTTIYLFRSSTCSQAVPVQKLYLFKSSTCSQALPVHKLYLFGSSIFLSFATDYLYF